MSRIQTVLCPVDFTPLTERCFHLAVEMCKKTGARLILHHNMDVRPPNYLSVNWMWSEDHEAEEVEKTDDVTADLAALFGKIPEGIEYEAKLTRGPLDTSVLYLAKELPADVVVMSTHGRSTGAHQSLTEKIILRAPCTVLTTGESYDPEFVLGTSRARPPEEMAVLVPTDFSAEAEAAWSYAIDLAHRMPHRFVLLHVAPTAAEAEIEKARQRLERLIPPELAERATVEVRTGDASVSVLESARENDALFILLGARGKGLIKRFLFGTTTLSVLHDSPCPVLFVPPSARLPRSEVVAASAPG